MFHVSIVFCERLFCVELEHFNAILYNGIGCRHPFEKFCSIFLSRGSTGREKNDKPLPSAAARPNTFMRGSSSKDLLDNQSQEEQRREMLETVKQLTGGMDLERNSADMDRNKTRDSGEKFFMSNCKNPGLIPGSALSNHSCYTLSQTHN